jgi:hypothetical protein
MRLSAVPVRDDDQRGLGVVRPKLANLLKNQAAIRIDPASSTQFDVLVPKSPTP